MRIPLNMSAQAPFAQSSPLEWRASVTLGPDVYGTEWSVRRIVTQASVTALDPVDIQLFVYRNSETPTALVDSTHSASTGDVSETEIELKTGERLVFVWVAYADPGPKSVAIVVLTGHIETGRR